MKRWSIRQIDTLRQKELSDALHISPIIAQLLINRGLDRIDKARTFLTGDVSELYDPFLMKGMPEAVRRIRQAIENKEKILIHGDYDVDGVTAIVLLVVTLRNFGIKPDYYIPDRLTEGYGLGEKGVSEAIKIGADLVITVDCGISSYEEVASLRAHNIDVIITDHHALPKLLPPAYTIINPLQKDCAYPDENLSGVSIAFKLCEALCSSFNSKFIWGYLDLVSLGTVSDVAPLVGENRILVKEGFKLLKNGSSNKGIKALLEICGLLNKEIGSFEIGFILGPRINAIGRLGSAELACELLLADDTKEAEILAKKLNEANRQRQRIESTTLKEAVSKIDSQINFKDHKVIVLHSEDWHTGVIGIVASRLSDRFYRPTILISVKDGLGRGSGRSIENFHLFEALLGCEDVLKEFGGHKYACGLTILERNLASFRKTINEIADRVLTPEDLVSHIEIDMEIALSTLDYNIVDEVTNLQPFGEGNPQPLFCSRDLRLVRPVQIIKNEHVKLWVTDGVKNFEAIGFGLAKDGNITKSLERDSKFDLCYSVSINTWQGLNRIQLKIEDIRPFVSSQP
ncbi:MAG: single-stranded-DNA-specific exonuclease RecJ [Candidatus Omnitrophica bacterium]|nr:single-stranded-DNA-specific exonuclease RecJ [Candidatus Omnitrophota bacterium]